MRLNRQKHVTVVLVLIKRQVGRLVRLRVELEFKLELFQTLAVMMLLTNQKSVLRQTDIMELGQLGLLARLVVDKVYNNVVGIIIAGKHLMFRKGLVRLHQVAGRPGQSGQIALFHAEERMLYVNDSTRALVKSIPIPSFVTLIRVPITAPGRIGLHAQPRVV